MTLREAVAKRIKFVRLPSWAAPDDHLELLLLDGGGVGPWATLHSPSWRKIALETGRAEDLQLAEQQVLLLQMLGDPDDRWEPYERAA